MVKRLAVRFGGYSKHCHRLGAWTEVPVHAPEGCHADGYCASGRTFLGDHPSGHLKGPEAAAAFLLPANGSRVVAALAAGLTRTARAIIIK